MSANRHCSIGWSAQRLPLCPITIRTAGYILSLVGLIGGALAFVACIACVSCAGIASLSPSLYLS